MTVKWHLIPEDTKEQKPHSTSLININYGESYLGLRCYNSPEEAFKLLKVWQISGMNLLDHVALGKKSWGGIFPEI